MPFILQDGRLVEVTDAQFAAYTGIEAPTIRTTAAERRARAAAEATPAGGQLIQATDPAAPVNNQEIINPNTTNTVAGQTLNPVPAPLQASNTQITNVPPIPGVEPASSGWARSARDVQFTREELNAAGITNIPSNAPIRPTVSTAPAAATPAQPVPTNTVTDGVDQIIPVPVTDGVDTVVPRSPESLEQEAEARAARPPLGIGGNYTTSFNPETGTYDVVNLDNGQVVESGLSELNAEVTASQFSQGDPQFETPEMPPELPDVTEPDPPGGNFGSVFDPETQSWSVIDNDTGVIVQTGFNDAASAELQAQLDSQPDPYANQFTDDDINASFTESDLVREPTDQDVIENDARITGENVGIVRTEPAPVGLTESEVIGDFSADPRIAGENVGLDTPAVVTDAARNRAQVQATLANQQRQADSGDWRFKIRLAPGARYLYRGDNGQGVQSGILAPLAVTDGVVFPYTPQVSTNYSARYTEADLPHSNYRGYFYNTSYVDSVQIEGTFTAQDTAEANYLLAVIHFFRSVTKMFYGQASEFRGAPPPLVFLQGFGAYQFSRHPCVISSFRYTLPRDVDYIRADVQPISGLNIQQQRKPGGVPPQSLPTNVFTGALARLAAAGVPKGAVFRPQAPDTLGTRSPTYVPTKMDITLELLPMQTRQQVSQEFNNRDFATGALQKKGFW